jgi:hypothetical protein
MIGELSAKDAGTWNVRQIEELRREHLKHPERLFIESCQKMGRAQQASHERESDSLYDLRRLMEQLPKIARATIPLEDWIGKEPE